MNSAVRTPIPEDAPGAEDSGRRTTLAADMARLAQAWQYRLDSLHESADTSWPAVSSVHGLLSGLPAGAARRRVMSALFLRLCGPLPTLQALATPAGRLALHSRLALLSRLTTLALLSRPGALRCCVERRARQAMEGAVGPALEALREASRSGPALPSHVANWVPIQWACVGYVDLLRIGAWPQNSLRQLVRLALPARWPVPIKTRELPAPHVPTRDALDLVGKLFAKESAW